MVSCEDELERFDAIITLSFYTGIPSGKTIKGVFEYALACGEFTNLTSSNTNFTIKFSGKKFKSERFKINEYLVISNAVKGLKVIFA